MESGRSRFAFYLALFLCVYVCFLKFYFKEKEIYPLVYSPQMHTTAKAGPVQSQNSTQVFLMAGRTPSISVFIYSLPVCTSARNRIISGGP